MVRAALHLRCGARCPGEMLSNCTLCRALWELPCPYPASPACASLGATVRRNAVSGQRRLHDALASLRAGGLFWLQPRCRRKAESHRPRRRGLVSAAWPASLHPFA